MKKYPVVTNQIDCACVIHGTAYDWTYVEKLYNMLSRHIPQGIKMHVYTEHDRSVPPHMIKHCLEDWPGITGPKKSWWYKMQLFNTEHYQGDLLYLDLDVVVMSDISWMFALSTEKFWSIRDFRYLQNENQGSMNSSVMWWDTQRFHYVWDEFCKTEKRHWFLKYPGDQDFISDTVNIQNRRFFDQQRIKSWRWQCLDGGYDFSKKQWKIPGAGTAIDHETSILVFHGNPKPNEVTDPVIQHYWAQ